MVSQGANSFSSRLLRGTSRKHGRRIRQQIAIDEHSPSQYRVDTVRNMDAWYAAFNVKLGDQLYLSPSDRAPVW